MAILAGIRVIVRRFLCIERRFLRHSSKKFYVHVLAQCAVQASVLNKHNNVIDFCQKSKLKWYYIILQFLIEHTGASTLSVTQVLSG